MHTMSATLHSLSCVSAVNQFPERGKVCVRDHLYNTFSNCTASQAMQLSRAAHTLHIRGKYQPIPPACPKPMPEAQA